MIEKFMKIYEFERILISLYSTLDINKMCTNSQIKCLFYAIEIEIEITANTSTLTTTNTNNDERKMCEMQNVYCICIDEQILLLLYILHYCI